MKRKIIVLLVIILFLPPYVLLGNKAKLENIKLRVAVFRGNEIVLSGSAGFAVSGSKENSEMSKKKINIINPVRNTSIKSENRGSITEKPVEGSISNRVNICFREGKLFLDDREISSPIIFKSKSEDRIKLGNDLYRGEIEIRLEEDNLVAINEVCLEEYLFSVVGGEIYSSWPMEVLKAQSVAARTYALYQYQKNKDKTYQLESSVDSQRYIGMAGENKNINKAVLETKGLVMTYQNNLIQAFFNSTCGGRTEDVSSLWPDNNLPYLKSKICSFCRDAANYNWKFSITRQDLEKILSTDENFKGKLRSLKITKLTRTGRVSELAFRTSNGDKKLNVSDFRRWIGQDKIKSAFFKINFKKDTFVFTGRGSGHGIGLCQEGAKTMADKKYRYDKILKFYYPGIKIGVI